MLNKLTSFKFDLINKSIICLAHVYTALNIKALSRPFRLVN